MSELTPYTQPVTVDLFEHWERVDRGHAGVGYYLLAVSSTPVGMTLKPGDAIVKRTYMPISPAAVFNEAHHPHGRYLLDILADHD